MRFVPISYFADEATASAFRWTHVAAGIGLPFFLALHIARERRWNHHR